MMTTKKTRKAAKRKKNKGHITHTQDAFDVLVMATMSAGKSTFINALIGRDLLPSANEATTACLTSVEQRRTAKYFRGACYSHTGIRIATKKDTSAEQVRAWNIDSQTKQIRLSGKFCNTGPASAPKLVLHDTPGPNNSQDSCHEEVMLEAVRTIPFRFLFYILDAGQLGTWDDRKLLEQLRTVLARRSSHWLVFILNKVDLLDSERGEDLVGYVAKAKHYLEELGYTQPLIIPTMATTALYARKALGEHPLTRAERIRLKQSLDGLSTEGCCPLNAASLPDDLKVLVRRKLEKTKKVKQSHQADTQPDAVSELEQLVTRSGIRTVEFLLNQRGITV